MNILPVITYLVIALIWTMLPLPASSDATTDSPETLLRSWLQPVSSSPSVHSSPHTEVGFPAHKAIARFYKQHDFQLAWTDRQGVLEPGEVLIKALAYADREGLDSFSYQPVVWKPAIHKVGLNPEATPDRKLSDIVALDISLTRSFLKYTSDLQKGRFNPDAYTVAKRPGFGLSPELIAEGLQTAISQERVQAFFDGLSPQNQGYQMLKKELERYETIKKLGGWPTIPQGPSLRPDAPSPRVPLLSRHLLITGDLPLAHFSSQASYTKPLQAAVRKFQQRNGLTADAVVGRKTLAQLNVPVEDRITQIKVNMERLRWMSADLGARHLMVNIPAFELKIIMDNVEQGAMRAIVGRKKRQTPVMTSMMTYLELNPFWNIPSSIARKDILPKIQSDPQYLIKNSIQVLDGWQRNAQMLDPMNIDWQGFSEKYLPYRLRQDPAPINALGQIKFMFPNHHAVYIHDTPGKSLFKKAQRSFSSGCIRVERPLELAQALLKNQQWDIGRIKDALVTKKSKTIVMRQPMPVHLVYFTAWVDDDSTLHFREDIYDRDRLLSPDQSPSTPPRLWCSNDALPSLGLQADGSGLCQHGPKAESRI